MQNDTEQNRDKSGALSPFQGETVIRIPLTELHPYPDHPYGIRDDPAMQDTVDSIKANGVVMVPVRSGIIKFQKGKDEHGCLSYRQNTGLYRDEQLPPAG